MPDMDAMNVLISREKIEQCSGVKEPWDVVTTNHLGECY